MTLESFRRGYLGRKNYFGKVHFVINRTQFFSKTLAKYSNDEKKP